MLHSFLSASKARVPGVSQRVQEVKGSGFKTTKSHDVIEILTARHHHGQDGPCFDEENSAKFMSLLPPWHAHQSIERN